MVINAWEISEYLLFIVIILMLALFRIRRVIGDISQHFEGILKFDYSKDTFGFASLVYCHQLILP